jgi:prolyl oligopeptidase
MRDNSKLARFLVGVVFSAVLVGIAPIAQSSLPPPAAPVRPIVDDYFGTRIVDPYRYMENLSNPEVQAWMKAQNDYTRRVLDSIPGRAKLLARIKLLDESEPAEISDVRRLPTGRIFYLKRSAAGEVAKLYLRDGLGGEEILVADPSKYDVPRGPHISIHFYWVSQDGRYIAVGGGSPAGDNAVKIIDTVAGKDTGETITRVFFGIGFVPTVWRPDNHSFFYTKLRDLPVGTPLSEILQSSQVYLHAIGTDPDKDQAVFGGTTSPLVRLDAVDVPTVVITPELPYALGLVTSSGGNRDSAIYVAPLASVGKPGTPWQKVCGVEDGVREVAVHGGDLFLLTHKDASRFKVVRTSLSKPDLATAQVVVPQSGAVITNIYAAGDALYVEELDGGIGRLMRVPFDTHTPKTVRLPFEGSLQLAGYAWSASPPSDPRISGTLLNMGSWIKADQLYAYDPATDQITNTGIQPLGPYDDPKNLTSVEVKVKSFDGTQVPLSIVYRKGIRFDGSNPTRLGGYGAFAEISPPAFYRWQLAWLERGGILAWAHVRGGGEYGEEWHRAGMMKNKLNTVRDFLACAHFLIDKKYTSSTKLAGFGMSAGGIMIGRAITMEPRLFAAALDQVGVSDTLRKEVGVNGPITALELGSTKTKEGFEALLAMSPYNNVVDHTPYPAVLLMTGINDANAAPWQVAKMAARLQAATSSDKPILLRINYQGAHVPTTKTDIEELLADQWSFLLWQFGDLEFQRSESQARSSAG